MQPQSIRFRLNKGFLQFFVRTDIEFALNECDCTFFTGAWVSTKDIIRVVSFSAPHTNGKLPNPIGFRKPEPFKEWFNEIEFNIALIL